MSRLIQYYSLWDHENKFGLQDGSQLDVSYLLKQDIHTRNLKGFDLETIESTSLGSNPRQILDIVERMVYFVSGRTIGPHQRKSGLRLINDLKINVRDNFAQNSSFFRTPQFMFGCLPYLFTGFDFDKLSSPGKDGVNNYQNGFEFLKALSDERDLKVSSYLCAHRGVRVRDGPDMLLPEIDSKGVVKALNLIRGLTHNGPGKSVEVTLYQPAGTPLSATYVFPQILLSYAEKGELTGLIRRLNEHFLQMSSLLDSVSDKNFHFKLKSIDEIVSDSTSECTRRFGSQWSRLDENKLYLLAGKETEKAMDPLAEVAYFMTIPEVKRLMPFYSNPDKISQELFDKNLRLAEETRDRSTIEAVTSILELFKEKQSAAGRAIFETIFYYLWGKNSALEKGVGIGLDTDHEMFQTAAWDLGWKEANTIEQQINSSPLIYARKSKDKGNEECLARFNLRQFWR